MNFKGPNPFSPATRPRTQAEWKIAGQVAETILNLELARKWGLIDDKGQPNLKLCEEVRGRAQQLGVGPEKPRT